jgi:HEAT repeat protein
MQKKVIFNIYYKIFLLSACILSLAIFIGCGKDYYEDQKLGITIKELGSDLDQRWSLKGVIVETIKPGSSADKLIRAGELISYIIDEREINNKKKFQDALGDALKKDKKAILRISKVISASSADDLGILVRADPEDRGVIAEQIKSGSKADKAGIKPNTLIYTIDKTPIKSADQYNQVVTQVLQSSGKATINLAREIIAKKIGKVGIEEDEVAGKGVIVKKLEMIEVEGSPASMEGIKEGDLITHVIDEMAINDIKSYKKAIKKAGNADRVIFRRGEMGGIKLTVIDSLGEIGDTRAIDPLIKSLQSDDRWIRRSAANALAGMNDPRIIQPLVWHLSEANEPDPEVRRSAAGALAKMYPIEALEPLALALHDSSLGVRLLAGLALGRIGQPATESLLKASQDSDSKVRDIAIATLGTIGGKLAKDELKRVLANENEEPTVKLTAIQALYKMGDPDSITELKKVAVSGDPKISAFIKELLGEQSPSI